MGVWERSSSARSASSATPHKDAYEISTSVTPAREGSAEECGFAFQDFMGSPAGPGMGQYSDEEEVLRVQRQVLGGGRMEGFGRESVEESEEVEEGEEMGVAGEKEFVEKEEKERLRKGVEGARREKVEEDRRRRAKREEEERWFEDRMMEDDDEGGRKEVEEREARERMQAEERRRKEAEEERAREERK
eukprot:1196922-Rhodomonas_salina.1